MTLVDSEFESFNKTCQNKEVKEFNDFLNSIRPYLDRLHRSWDKTTKGITIESLKELNCSLNDMIKLVLGFYSSLDKDLYNALANILNDEKTKKDYQETSPNNKWRINYTKYEPDGSLCIGLRPQNNLYGLASVCHEFAHLVSRFGQDSTNSKSDLFPEVESMFLEKVFIEYLYNIQFISEEERKTYFRFYKNSVNNKLQEIFYENDILNYLHGELLTEENLKGLEEMIAKSPNNKDFYRRLSFMQNEVHSAWYFIYVLGEVVSELLFVEYKREPQKTMAKFKKYLGHTADIDPQTMLKELTNKSIEETIETYLALNKELSEIEQE